MTANTVCISVLVVLVLSVCGAAQADDSQKAYDGEDWHLNVLVHRKKLASF